MGAIHDHIVREVLSWPDVTAEPHRFGGIEFRFFGKELGHLHGDRLVDLPFPTRIRNDLVAAGRASPHHILPHSGWVSYWIRRPEDARAVLDLFRMQYERLAQAREKIRQPATRHAPPDPDAASDQPDDEPHADQSR